jgi:hypothetical protein
MPPDNDPLPMRQWLVQQPSSVRQLLDRANQLDQINRALQQWNDAPWLAHIRLANIRGSTLVFYSSSAATLVNLRHHQQALLDFVQRNFQLACTHIEAKVRPDSSFQQPGV